MVYIGGKTVYAVKYAEVKSFLDSFRYCRAFFYKNNTHLDWIEETGDMIGIRPVT